MSTIVAQANPANNGASNAADFQPPTGNPQTVPGQLFPESPGLQPVSSQDILQNRGLVIQVPVSSTGESKDVTIAKSNAWLIPLIVVVVCVVVILITWLRRRQTI